MSVFSSCSFIPLVHFKTSLEMSVTMVTRCDVISSRWSSHFLSENACFFQILSTIKEKLVDEVIQSSYLCCFTYQAQKTPVLIWILGGDHCCWRHRAPAAPPPIKYTSLRKIKGFPLKAKVFRNTATYQKTLGRGSINTHPPGITVGV